MTEGTLVGFSTIALPQMQAANTLAVNNIHDNQNLTQTRLNETKNDDIHIGNIVLYIIISIMPQQSRRCISKNFLSKQI